MKYYIIEREKSLGHVERWNGFDWGRDIDPEVFRDPAEAERMKVIADKEHAYAIEIPVEFCGKWI